VLRGKYVLENLLASPPPPPPPNVPSLNTERSGQPLSMKEAMQLHRASPACASCHAKMDPIGFALENFDADAKWRTKQGGAGGVPIDVSVDLWDGTKVTGPSELRQRLLYYSPQFVRMVTEKMMTFGIGRGMEYYDMPVIRSIVRDAQKNNYRFSSLIMGIIKSAPFQTRVKTGNDA
jgi:hypothetical protein